MSDEAQGQPDTNNPAHDIESGFNRIKLGLVALTGDAAEHPMIHDARTHLNAAAACIDAFLGAPGA